MTQQAVSTWSYPSPAPITGARRTLAGRGQPNAPIFIGNSRTLPREPTLFRDPTDREFDWVISDLDHDVMYQRGTLSIPPHVLANLQRPAFREHDWELVIAHEIFKVDDSLGQLSPAALSQHVAAMPTPSTAGAVWLERSMAATSTIMRGAAKAAAMTAGAMVMVGARAVAADPVLLGARPIEGGWAVYVLAVWGRGFD